MKKLSLLAALLMLFSNTMKAQSNHPILIGGSFSLDRCNMALGSGTPFLPVIGYSTGINAYYTISRRFGLDAGLQYSSKGFAMGGDAIVYDTSQKIMRDFKIRSQYNLNYLEIPLRAVLMLGKENLHFLASAGIIPGILFSSGEYTRQTYSDGQVEKQNTKFTQGFDNSTYPDFHPIIISAVVSGGIDYTLSPELHCRLEPTFCYGLSSFVKSIYTDHLWSTGLNFSVYYALR